MRYLLIEVSPFSDNPCPWWGKLLRKVLPAANSDIEQYFSLVRKWWLEIDDSGKPSREIGFDSANRPIVLGPIGKNSGFLVDSSDDWNDSKEDSTEAENEFEKTWQVMWEEFGHLVS